MKTAIITANTKGYHEKTENSTGVAIQKVMEQAGFQTVVNATLPEDTKILATFLNRLADDRLVDIVITIGSTGVKKTDCIPETTQEVVERLIPGIPEAMRGHNLRYSKRVIMDRSIAGIRKETLVVNLPEEEKLAKDGLEYVLPELVHLVESMK